MPDTYHEVNGVARTARHLTDYALRHALPFMCVRPGAECRHWTQSSVEHVELSRGRLAVRVEKDLWQDPRILRYRRLLRSRFEEFRPDVVHVTSMGDFGLLGWRLAREFGLPIVASWHTNIHEYAAWRFDKAARFVPARPRRVVSRGLERLFLEFSLWFYRKGAVGMAPNPELVELLRQGTDKPAFLMERGVDTELFNCAKRAREADGKLVFGYVGRLSTEKNLRVLKRLEQALMAGGLSDYRIEVVGHGAESTWLEANLRQARLRGVLLGEPLARAYADLDVFLFPSRTDTYGNVVWEAAALGRAIGCDGRRRPAVHRARRADGHREPVGRRVRGQRRTLVPRSPAAAEDGRGGAHGGAGAVLGQRVRPSLRRGLRDRRCLRGL